jgi:hypothetical protein
MRKAPAVIVHAVATVFSLLPSLRAFGAELAPQVLAQVHQSGGHRPDPVVRSVRILGDGRIEALDDNKWKEIGTLSPAAVRRFKNVTDVMTAKSRLATDDTRVADAESIEYSVRNGAGEVVLIGRAGAQEAQLMQGGASSIIRVLEGLRALVWISY